VFRTVILLFKGLLEHFLLNQEGKIMSFIYLLIAIVSEVSGTTAMKMSQGFSRLFPSIMIFVFYGLSLAFLTAALKTINVSIAYAIWSGLGTAFIAIIGIIWFKEPVSLIKIVSLLLIIAGVIGLNLSGETHGGGETAIKVQSEKQVH
jgi:small multidrug resistance pump